MAITHCAPRASITRYRGGSVITCDYVPRYTQAVKRIVPPHARLFCADTRYIVKPHDRRAVELALDCFAVLEYCITDEPFVTPRQPAGLVRLSDMARLDIPAREQ